MRFTGHERDMGAASSTADDLDYMHARHYGPILARFTSLDLVRGSARRPQSWNLFAYAGNNPIVAVDPFGLSREKTTGPPLTAPKPCDGKDTPCKAEPTFKKEPKQEDPPENPEPNPKILEHLRSEYGPEVVGCGPALLPATALGGSSTAIFGRGGWMVRSPGWRWGSSARRPPVSPSEWSPEVWPKGPAPRPNLPGLDGEIPWDQFIKLPLWKQLVYTTMRVVTENANVPSGTTGPAPVLDESEGFNPGDGA